MRKENHSAGRLKHVVIKNEKIYQNLKFREKIKNIGDSGSEKIIVIFWFLINKTHLECHTDYENIEYINIAYTGR